MNRHVTDLFNEKQYMDSPDYEIYNYSDTAAPRIFPHRHEYYEIYLCLCDDLEYVIENRVYHLGHGDLILLPPGFMHYPASFRAQDGGAYTRMVLWCSTEYFGKFLAIDPDLEFMWRDVREHDSYLICPSQNASRHLENLFRRLLDERRQGGFASAALSFSILLEIFAQINRAAYQSQHVERAGVSSDTFNNLIYYIHTHLTEDLSLGKLSEQLYVSKGYISRIFRENMEISLHQYILALRLEACREIMKKGTAAAAAAEQCGFHDYSSFYRAFKNAYRMSPQEYMDSL